MCIQKHMLKVQKAAERYLPTLEIKEGFPITMDDMDGIHVWSFRYMSEVGVYTTSIAYLISQRSRNNKQTEIKKFISRTQTLLHSPGMLLGFLEAIQKNGCQKMAIISCSLS
ncbi:PREDICTED: uncharacterized protein LOC109208217 isoform X4 [Nicotiana attenuata]|nr:PREDICTED: uncharacterized protein LOC109208217 isoform X4 [Nicotiana attenuata]